MGSVKVVAHIVAECRHRVYTPQAPPKATEKIKRAKVDCPQRSHRTIFGERREYEGMVLFYFRRGVREKERERREEPMSFRDPSAVPILAPAFVNLFFFSKTPLLHRCAAMRCAAGR